MDGLSALARSRLGLDPLSGHLILFRNRRGDRLKILVWDRSGFWVLYKRLEKGTFSWPRSSVEGRLEMRTSELLLLLSGGDITRPEADELVRPAERKCRRRTCQNALRSRDCS